MHILKRFVVWRVPGLCLTTSATGSTVTRSVHCGVLGNHRRALLRSSADQERLALGDNSGTSCPSSPLDDDDDGGADETEWSRAGWINSAP